MERNAVRFRLLRVAPFEQGLGETISLLAGAETRCNSYKDSPISFASGRNAKSGGFRVSGFQSINAIGCQYQSIVVGEDGWLFSFCAEFVSWNGGPFERFVESVEGDSQSD